MSERVVVVEIDGVEYLVVEEVQKQEVEFRLYYDERGKVLFYTCEKPEGQYIVIDKQTYIEARPDLCVKDGKLTKYIPGIIISKLEQDIDGIPCAKDDISIIVDNDYKDHIKYKLVSYEL